MVLMRAVLRKSARTERKNSQAVAGRTSFHLTGGDAKETRDDD